MNNRIADVRKIRILELLASNKEIKFNLLAEILDVSYVTLRKDLEVLEKRGMIRRAHGNVELSGEDNAGRRMAFDYLIKRKIAKAAALTIEEGETVMLESGSCCALFAEELVLAVKNITIITNSAFIANYIRRLTQVKIILLGGYFQPESQVMVGSITEKCAAQFFFNKFFLGTDGFIPGLGFTGRDHLRVVTAIEIAKYAEKVFILTEAAKFNRRGAYNLIHFDRLAGVFTDDGIPKEAETSLIKSNVKLHKVPSKEEKIKWCHFPGQPPFIINN